MTQALVFDMDGTIVDNMSYHQQAWLTFLDKYNISFDASEFHAQNHGTIEEMLTRFFGDIEKEKLQSLGEEKEALYRSLYQNELKELKGLTGLLKEAKKRGIKTGMATMSSVTNIDFVLIGLNLAAYFDVIVGGHHIKKGKPHPEIYELILSRLHVPAANTIAFEDSQGGTASALAAGIKVIGVTTSHTKKEFKKWGVGKCIEDFEGFKL